MTRTEEDLHKIGFMGESLKSDGYGSGAGLCRANKIKRAPASPRSLPATSRRNSGDTLWSAMDNLSIISRVNTPVLDHHRKAPVDLLTLGNTQQQCPPQFSGNFLEEDSEYTAQLKYKQYLQRTRETETFPFLLCRERLPTSTLSTRSSALDLVPQTSPKRVSDYEQGSNDRYRRLTPPNLHNGYQNCNSSSQAYRSNDNSASYTSAPFVRPEQRYDYGYSVTQTPPYSPIDQGNQKPLQTSSVCRYYQQGYCSRGDRCKYSHQIPLPKVALPPSNNNFSLPPQMAGCPSGLMEQLNAAAAAYFNGQQVLFSNPNQQAPQQSGAYGGAIKPKRNSAEDDAILNRFAAIPFNDFVGQLFILCQDQHGCRYLQKVLEARNPSQLESIFTEIYPCFVELMVDPFGNYLCQRLIEYCTDKHRSMIVEAVGPRIADICINMHGTRAVQKMIEYLTLPAQIRSLVASLSVNAVLLIKDLNGNHVIQKCLNRLTSEQNQFIYNAVATNCIEVGSHRHGCCVLQRCIDFSSESQKMQLVSEITYHALSLVQDPYGNYVVQYILDLNEGVFADAIIRRFIGNVCILSVQKFSSNVIEKCIRVAEAETRRYLVAEMMDIDQLDHLLRDSYANYVVQTAIDYANLEQRNQLVDMIRPLLVHIRHTPHGKRFSSKLERELYSAGVMSNRGNDGGNFGAPLPHNSYHFRNA